MTAIQNGAVQQPAGIAQQGQMASSTPDTRSTTDGQPQQPQPQQPQVQQVEGQQTQSSGATQAQGQAPAPDFSQLLQQQIAQAMQPVLDDFQRQVAQTVESHAAEITTPAASGQGGQPPTQQAATVVQSAAGQAGAQQLAGQGGQVAQQAQGAVQQAQQAVPGAQPSAQPRSLVQGALQHAQKTVERQSEEWLSSLLVSGLTALLTETTHAAIQQSAEHGLHALLQTLFKATPEHVSSQEIQLKVEQTLQAILREALDAMFAEQMRTTLQQSGSAAIQGSFHGDFSGALQNVEHILKALGEALLTVLRREWPTVLRLAIAIVLLAVVSSLEDNQRKPHESADGATGT